MGEALYKENYVKDFLSGKQAEAFIINLLNRKDSDILAESNKGKTKSELIAFDIEATHIPSEQVFTIECKFDKMETRTGNIAIEYHNCFQNKPSGIFATTADLYVYLLNPKKVYVASVPRLKAYFSNAPYLRDISGAGDGNANIRLFKSKTILNDVFNRIDDLPAKSMTKLILSLLVTS